MAQKITHLPDYRQRRKLQYPTTGEQLDAAAKLAHWLHQQGHNLPDDVVRWVDQVQQVKHNNPKPDTNT